MNCLLEVVAGAYLGLRSRCALQAHDDLAQAEEDLEVCRANLADRERGLGPLILSLGREALASRAAGDLSMATRKMQERRRCQARQDKLRSGLCLLDKQLDALRSNELDKQLMRSLRQSSKALRAAGIDGASEEAEKVMTELEGHLRDASELNSVLAAPLQAHDGPEAELDLDAELAGLLYEQPGPTPPSAATSMQGPPERLAGPSLVSAPPEPEPAPLRAW